VDYGMTASATFAFKTRGGQTSCPYEGEVRSKYYQPGNHILSEATMQIEVPKIQVTSAPSVLNVPANRTATFTLGLQNESETGEDVWFQVVVDEETNPNGAELKIDGASIANGRLFLVKAGETLQKTLTLGKGTVDSYENIGIILQSQCDDISDITYVSAEFVPACSEVAISSPSNNFIVNADSQTGDTLYVTINGYDVNFPNFGYIRLEYRPVSSPNWNTLKTFYPSALYPNAQGTETTKEDIGTRSTIVYPWKMPEADGQYELRATTASVNISNNTIVGDPLSTYSTAAITGYKDVHRPASLGAPSPASGILAAGDELSITFNEDIQTGMLTQNNFSISGVLNAQEIAEPNVGLLFAGTQSAQTELPIYTNGSFSIETWFKRDASSAGTLFAFGANDNYLSLGIDAQSKAVLKTGTETYTSTTAIANDATWKYIALTYNRESNSVSVYEYEGDTDKTLFSNKTLTATPETQGKLFVGNNATANDGFEGALAQLHFYGVNRPEANVAGDKSVSKSGREYGLIGYWTLEEGEGTVAKDKARSRNLVLNADWYIYPSGRAKQTNGSNYFSITTSTYPLNIFSDFTLEFWFRSENTSQTDKILFSADNGHIGTNASGGLALYKKDGTVNQVLTPANLVNTLWHHVALSVKRSGSAKVYIDGVATASFDESLLGTFASGNYYFGAKRANDNTYSQHFAGYFDEIRIWNSALTAEGVLLNKNSKLTGNESGLQAYYPFETYTRQSNGLITVTATDDNMTGADTAAGTASISTTAMSVKDVRTVEDVPFTFVSSSNKIVFTLDPTYFSRVEGATLSISAKDIPDMRNNKSNTESWTAYVNRNALLWDSESVNLTMEEGETRTFTARIVNMGGTTVSYAVENLPSWLSVSSSAGNLQPLAGKDLTFTVYQGVNIGNYETEIGLTGGNGVIEILPVQLKVTGARPDWSVNPNDFESSMNITGQIKIDGAFQEDENDLLAAFIGETCVGVTSPVYISTNNVYFTFATVYGNSQHSGQPLIFKLWDASTGRVYPRVETSAANIAFAPQAIVGSISNPVVFNALNIAEQRIALKKGWTWISTNLVNSNPDLLSRMKTSLSEAGVMIKGSNAYIQQPNWAGTLTEISETSMYRINTTRDHTLTLEGQQANPATTPVAINNGWNWIGYIPSFSLPVNSALAGVDAQTGDIIKAQDGYAQYTAATGWIGNLSYMQAGKGYMYYSGSSSAQTLIYPSAASSSPLRSAAEENAAALKWTVDPSLYSNSMTFTSIAVVGGVEQQSDQIEIAAFAGAECRGSVLLQAVESKYIGFLMAYGEGNEVLTFKIFDHATGVEHIAYPAVTFIADAINGNPAEPFVISDAPTGLGEINSSSISIYPNPASVELWINHPWSSIDVVEIVDVNGRIISREDDFTGQSVRVASLANGLYLLKLTQDGKTYLQKFTKK
jgi:hypothetical protein